jgi:hypothetical protein
VQPVGARKGKEKHAPAESNINRPAALDGATPRAGARRRSRKPQPPTPAARVNLAGPARRGRGGRGGLPPSRPQTPGPRVTRRRRWLGGMKEGRVGRGWRPRPPLKAGTWPPPQPGSERGALPSSARRRSLLGASPPPPRPARPPPRLAARKFGRPTTLGPHPPPPQPTGDERAHPPPLGRWLEAHHLLERRHPAAHGRQQHRAGGDHQKVKLLIPPSRGGGVRGGEGGGWARGRLVGRMGRSGSGAVWRAKEKRVQLG